MGASLSRDTTFVPAAAYDEEHPEELSYRPFPIAPFLTATASVDDPALARIVHPDLNKTLEMLDQAASVPPMRLRPGSQTAQLMWAQQFKGEAINLSSLIDLRRRIDAGPARQAPGAHPGAIAAQRSALYLPNSRERPAPRLQSRPRSCLLRRSARRFSPGAAAVRAWDRRSDPGRGPAGDYAARA